MVLQTTNPNETVYARRNDAILIETEDRKEISGEVHFVNHGGWTVEFESFADARLFFGLWVRCGPWLPPESDHHLPLDVVADGRAALASYLLVGHGGPDRRSTEWVRGRLELSTTQAVRNYANDIRWSVEDDDFE